MKKLNIVLFTVMLSAFSASAQSGNIGIATITPNSKLQIDGSLAIGYRAVVSSTTLTVNDYALEFAGVTADSVLLPDATTCQGRIYLVKNTNSPATELARIVTTSGQTIDGLTADTIKGHEAATYISNGADWQKYSVTGAAGATGPTGFLADGTATGNTTYWDGSTWVLDNSNIYNAGTTVGIGSSTFDATNPEKLLVDAGTTTSVNAITGKGVIDSYLQLNIQNGSTGTNASSDVVATADNGDETTNYVDMGINGSGNTGGIMGNANDAYLYNMGENLLIGTGTAAKSLVLMTGGVDQTANERMRIDGDGNVGIGNNAPAYKLDVNGTLGLGESGSTNGVIVLKNNTNSNSVTINPGNTTTSYSVTLPVAQGAASSVLTNDGSGVLTWGATTNTAWGLEGNTGTNFSTNFVGTIDSNSLRFRTSNTERFVIDSIGNARFGTATTVPNTINPEKFLVDAGTTESVNVIVGKGTIDSYLQLNIQNFSNGTSASSDMVATADNGDETNNYIDMGINSSGNSSGVMGDADDAYLYNVGQDLLIAATTPSKSIQFLVGGTDESADEKMRIDGSGNVGIHTTSPAYELDVNGTIRTGKSSTTNGSMVYSNSTNNHTVTINSGITSANYALTLPTSQGGAGEILSNDGSGVLSWVAPDSGPTGPTGLTGNTGANGVDGADGATGPTGLTGAAGADGADGADGAAGATGPTGADGANGDRYATTSATSFTVPTVSSSATFTVGTGLSYSIGQSVVVTPVSTPADLFRGSVTAYNSGTGSITVLCSSTTGAGNTYSSWAANLDGAVGAAGANGATGATGATGANGSNGTNGYSVLSGTTAPTGGQGNNGDFYIRTSTNFIYGPKAAGSWPAGVSLVGATGATGAAGTNGTNGTNGATGATGADGSTNAWGKTGTSGTSSTTNFIGTTDSRSFRVRTNNTQRMVVDSLGRVAIGSTSTTIDASNPEKLLVDAGTTTSVNAIAAKGSINNYFQVNVQNLSTGTAASTDIVATADNGDESNNYIDMGINGSGNTSAIMGGPDDSYIYNVGGDMFMGAGTAGQSYIFMTGGTDPSTNERMRIDGSGNIGIGTASPAYKLDVNGTLGLGKSSSTNGVLVFKNNSNANAVTINPGTTSASYSLTLPTAQGAASTVLTNNGSGVLTWAATTATAWGVTGNSGTAYGTHFMGTTDNKSLRFRTNNSERFVIDSLGDVRVGSSTTVPNSTNPEQFLVDAGTTTSITAIGARGSINNNLQVNVQNSSTGTTASSNFVATADNGTTSTNLLVMGMNNSGNTSNVFGSADDAHVYTLGQDLLIGTGTASKSLRFLTGGTSEASNERMIIDGSGNVGIGTTAPGSKLDVEGTLRLSGSTSGYVGFAPAAAAGGTTYTLPSADGTSGQALVTNGSATLSWSSVASPTLLVAASRTSAYTPAASYATLAYNSASTNVGTAYNTSTGVFTAPATGLYQIIVNNNFTFGNGMNDGLVGRIVVNGTTDMESSVSSAPYSSPSVSGAMFMTDIVSMTSGQTANITIGGLVNTCTPKVSTGQTILRIIRLN